MRTLLPAMAALTALVAAPAAGQSQWSSSESGETHWSSQSAFGAERHHRDGRSRHRGDVVAVTHSYGGEWALYNNRSSAPDSYNDWWHDRPDRAYPRWIQSNQDCKRVWWSGGGWRC